jgi:hypothetical protein
MERIRTDSSETVFITIFFGFRNKADSVRIRIQNQILSVTKMDRIWSEYRSVADKHFVGSLVDRKVKLACKFSTYINIYS